MPETLETTIENNKVIIEGNIKEKTKIYEYIKPILGCILTLLFSMPILLIVFLFGIIVKIDSHGPMFYTQERVGKNGKVFKIYKLRSMVTNAEANGESKWAEKDDPRITKVGKFIRKVRIDELPQFLNILKGDMALIGPRPERPDLTEEFAKQIPDFKQRLLVKPGITGLAQVNGGYDHTPEEKLSYDKVYVQNLSFKQDLMIFFKTIKVVLTGHGAR